LFSSLICLFILFHFRPFNLTLDGKRIHLAANGEIYNHNSLYSDLQKKHGWNEKRISGSDCEVIAHAYAKLGGPAAVRQLDGMFAFVIFEECEETGKLKTFAARDPVGIKPLYYGRTHAASDDGDAYGYVFSSELKALVGHVDPATVVALPPGHYWTPEEGMVRYYEPDWLMKVSSCVFIVSLFLDAVHLSWSARFSPDNIYILLTDDLL